MPVFVEDPSQLSKARLKSDLIAHNVALPPAKSKKEVYVELHTRHVDQKNGADFSSDEEQDQGEDDEEPKDAEALDPSHLTDDDLRSALLQHGVKAGPIVASTRAVYERKLRNLLLSNGHSKSNGKSDDKENCADEAVLYSDSEKEEDSGEELEEEPDIEEPLTQADLVDQSQQDSKQEPVPEIFKHLVADKNNTPSGIYATRRRPIKGAAGRPVQYVYPDTPVSPTTSQRQEVERRLVPLKIQILVFLIVALILYVIYVYVEDYAFNPFLNLLDVLNQGLDTDETGTQEVEELLELE